MKLAVINGPNLNLLGKREPHIYGHKTLADLKENLDEIVKANNSELIFFQSNHEGEIIDFIQQTTQKENLKGIVINPAAFTHSSIALRDALLSGGVPFIEVHISNVYAREEFRKKSFLNDKALGVIIGLGLTGYEMALKFFLERS